MDQTERALTITIATVEWDTGRGWADGRAPAPTFPGPEYWAEWQWESRRAIRAIILSPGAELAELWIDGVQQLTWPIRAQELIDMAEAGVRLPLPPIRPGVVVRAKVIPPPDPAPDGASSGR